MGQAAAAVIVRYTPRALAELDAILDFVVERSPSGGGRVQHRIRTLIELLADFPEAGQRTSVERLRRLVVTPFPYVVFYRVNADAIVIVSVRHTARRPE